MGTRILEIPEDAALAAWLERELVGLDLGMLARELALIRNIPPSISPAAAFEAWLGPDRQQILAEGLQQLPPQKLRQLLAEPQLLPPLQELVLVEGAAYWQNLLARTQGAAPSAPIIATDAVAEKPTPGQPAVERPRPSSGAGNWRWWALAAAAVVVLGVGLFLANRPAPGPTWGWNEPNLLAQTPPAPEYLDTLAEAGQAWFKQRPDSQAALEKRIRELRQGCDRLIAHDHPPLADADRAWLRERCRAWRDKFDQQLAALEGGADPLSVRGEMDAIVEKLVSTLRGRAQELRA